jgi:hypothetical protein
MSTVHIYALTDDSDIQESEKIRPILDNIHRRHKAYFDSSALDLCFYVICFDVLIFKEKTLMKAIERAKTLEGSIIISGGVELKEHGLLDVISLWPFSYIFIHTLFHEQKQTTSPSSAISYSLS